MKPIWTTTIEGYALRQKRLAEASGLINKKNKYIQSMTDRLAIHNEMENINEVESKRGLFERAQAVNAYIDKTFTQIVDFKFRQKITNLRYKSPLPPEKILRQIRLSRAEALLEKKQIKLQRLKDDDTIEKHIHSLENSYRGFGSEAPDTKTEQIEKLSEKIERQSAELSQRKAFTEIKEMIEG